MWQRTYVKLAERLEQAEDDSLQCLKSMLDRF
jgi:hypothetical protein